MVVTFNNFELVLFWQETVKVISDVRECVEDGVPDPLLYRGLELLDAGDALLLFKLFKHSLKERECRFPVVSRYLLSVFVLGQELINIKL